MSAIAVLAATAAAWLACRPGVRASLLGGAAPSGSTGWLPRAGPLALLALVAGVAFLPTHGVALLAIGFAMATGVAVLWRRQAARVGAARAAAEVREACEHLGAELAAGLPPGPALRRVADSCAALRPVADAFDLGGDVAAAMRMAAAAPGRGDLVLLAAGWQVAHHSGGGLADAVGSIAARLRDDEQTARLVAGELSSARATARLVAGLPLAALGLGAGAGGSPWAFLLLTTPGLLCLGGGLALGLAGLWWIEALTRADG